MPPELECVTRQICRSERLTRPHGIGQSAVTSVWRA